MMHVADSDGDQNLSLQNSSREQNPVKATPLWMCAARQSPLSAMPAFPSVGCAVLYTPIRTEAVNSNPLLKEFDQAIASLQKQVKQILGMNGWVWTKRVERKQAETKNWGLARVVA
jgi:hypothetical protein